MASIAELIVDVGVDAAGASDDADKLGSSFDRMASDATAAGAKVDASFDRISSSARSVDDAGRQAGAGLDRVGEAADITDTRAMGFRDTITGLGDTFKGLTDDSAGLGERLLLLGMGIGDLGSGIFNFLVPAMKQLTIGNIKAKAATVAHRAALVASTAATKALAVAQRVLNAVMRANPIGIVITVIAALVAAIIVAWKKSETFRRVVTAVWNGVKRAVSAVVNWFVNTAWPFIQRVWNGISNGAQRLKDRVVGVWNAIKRGIGNAVDGIKGFLGGIWDGVVSGAKAAVNGAIGAVNSIIRGINQVTGAVGIPGIPQIPRLAEGGIVRVPTLALLGESGPEAVMPLSGMNRVGGGPTVIRIEGDGSARADFLIEELRGAIRERGGLDLALGGDA